VIHLAINRETYVALNMDEQEEGRPSAMANISRTTIPALRRISDHSSQSAHIKLGIFESVLRQDVISTPLSQPTNQDDIDELTGGILSLLNPKDGNLHPPRQRHQVHAPLSHRLPPPLRRRDRRPRTKGKKPWKGGSRTLRQDDSLQKP
jgi:hypothetical protein